MNKKYNILIIEDDMRSYWEIRSHLEGLKHCIVNRSMIKSSDEGKIFLEENFDKIDLIFLDIQLVTADGKDTDQYGGWHLMALIKKLGVEKKRLIPTIVLSGIQEKYYQQWNGIRDESIEWKFVCREKNFFKTKEDYETAINLAMENNGSYELLNSNHEARCFMVKLVSDESYRVWAKDAMFIKYEDVVWIEKVSGDNYCMIHLRERIYPFDTLKILAPIKTFKDDGFLSQGFTSPHESFVVKKKAIINCNEKDNSFTLILDGKIRAKSIPYSRAFKDSGKLDNLLRELGLK